MKVNNFETVMKSLKGHYTLKPEERGGVTIESIIGKPVRALGEKENGEFNNLPQDAKDAVNVYRADLDASNEAQQKDLTQDTNQYIDTKNKSEFQKKMEEAKIKAQERSAKQIEQVFDRLTEVGNENPDKQDEILQATITIGDLADAVWSMFGSFVTELIANIVKWFAEAIQKIKDTFNSIKDTVVNFFKKFW